MALTVADAQGRRLFESTGQEAFTNGFIAWSPDGTRIAGVRLPANAAGSVWVVDPTGAQPARKLMSSPSRCALTGWRGPRTVQCSSLRR